MDAPMKILFKNIYLLELLLHIGRQPIKHLCVISVTSNYKLIVELKREKWINERFKKITLPTDQRYLAVKGSIYM